MNFDSQSFQAELADLLDEPNLASDTLLFDIEAWDSLNILSFIMFVDRDFKLVLSPDAIGECQTVGDLQSLVNSQVKQAA
jgi:acyl carrier protein